MGQAHSGHTAARALTTEGGGAAIDPLLADYSPALHAGGGSRHRSRLSVQWSLNHRKKKQKQKPSPPTPLASRVEQPQSTAPDASGVGIQPKKNLKAASAAAAAAASAEEITLFVSAPTPPPPGSLRLAHSTHAASPPPRFHLTTSEASVAKVLSPCQPQPPQHHGEDTKENTTIQKISSNPVKEAELVVEEGKADELGDGTYGRLKSCFKPGSLGPPMCVYARVLSITSRISTFPSFSKFHFGAPFARAFMTRVHRRRSARLLISGWHANDYDAHIYIYI